MSINIASPWLARSANDIVTRNPTTDNVIVAGTSQIGAERLRVAGLIRAEDNILFDQALAHDILIEAATGAGAGQLLSLLGQITQVGSRGGAIRFDAGEELGGSTVGSLFGFIEFLLGSVAHTSLSFAGTDPLLSARAGVGASVTDWTLQATAAGQFLRFVADGAGGEIRLCSDTLGWEDPTLQRAMTWALDATGDTTMTYVSTTTPQFEQDNVAGVASEWFYRAQRNTAGVGGDIRWQCGQGSTVDGKLILDCRSDGAVRIETSAPGTRAAVLEFDDGDTAAVSVADEMRVRYSENEERGQLSVNGLPYQTITTVDMLQFAAVIENRSIAPNDTTTSGGFVDLELSAIFAFGGRPVLFLFEATLFSTAAATSVDFGIQIDSSGATTEIATLFFDTANQHQTISGAVILTPSDGDHTIELRWRRAAGVGTLTQDSDDQRLLQAIIL